jgi:hypothetical protein
MSTPFLSRHNLLKIDGGLPVLLANTNINDNDNAHTLSLSIDNGILVGTYAWEELTCRSV